MNALDELIRNLCPCGIKHLPIKSVFQRLKGTPITATKMKEIENPDGEIRIFAGGKTVINATEDSIPNANITRVPAVLVQSRGVIDVVYYEKPFTFKNEMWAYTHSSKTAVKYLYYVLKNNIQRFRDAASGMGSLPQISLSVTEDFIIPVPPLEIQREIVRVLDKFTMLSAELSAELSARQKQYSYYRDQLLTFHNDIPIKKIGNLTRVFSASRVHRNEWTDSGVPFLRSSDVVSFFNGTENSRGKAFISRELYEELSQKSGKVHQGDLLVTGGGTIGVPYVIPDNNPLYFKDADLVCIQKCSALNSRFLFHYFLSSEFKKYLSLITHDATIAHYTIAQISSTPVPVPPLDVQQRIVNVLDNFDAICSDLNIGLPAEISARQKQYEYYRDLLLSFKNIDNITDRQTDRQTEHN